MIWCKAGGRRWASEEGGELCGTQRTLCCTLLCRRAHAIEGLWKTPPFTKWMGVGIWEISKLPCRVPATCPEPWMNHTKGVRRRHWNEVCAQHNGVSFLPIATVHIDSY